jgi:beta-phosphoglucomutase
MRARGFEAVIFDVDGVLVDSPHEQAWRESLRELMEGRWSDIRGRTAWSPDAFDAAVYQEHISGRPRLSGARATLEHFRVPVDAGSFVQEYADHKQAMVVRLIEAGDFTAYPDALRLLLAVKDAGMRVAAASSSRNTPLLLRAIRLDTFAHDERIASRAVQPGMTVQDAFDADVSGRAFAHGKPHPDMFLAAAQELDASPGAAVVVEDSPAGVRAAKAGGMAAIGIARGDDADLLARAGADIVVASLDAVDVGALTEGRVAVSAR